MISIITAAHIDTDEKAEWLKEAIASVQKQTMDQWEIVIIDDLSPLKFELPDDERIRLLRTVEQAGPAKARNTGVAVASYDAILPLDADDQLAGEQTLEIMFDHWQRNKSRVIYGDIQRYEKTDGKWRVAKVINLPGYTFELSLKPSGIIPVTALHSKECHIRAGGWKPEIELGLEDVEYWIAAGKAGFCGYHVAEITLLYRKHESSRSYKLRHVIQQESAMKGLIRKLHADVYNGRYPMGCCGGGGRATPQPQVNASASQFTPLANTENKVVVQYVGKRSGSWGLVGDTRTRYVIEGPGHKLEINVKDLDKFKRHGRGKDFAIGVAAPEDNGTEPKKELDLATFKGPEPELAMVERLDK